MSKGAFRKVFSNTLTTSLLLILVGISLLWGIIETAITIEIEGIVIKILQIIVALSLTVIATVTLIKTENHRKYEIYSNVAKDLVDRNLENLSLFDAQMSKKQASLNNESLEEVLQKEAQKTDTPLEKDLIYSTKTLYEMLARNYIAINESLDKIEKSGIDKESFKAYKHTIKVTTFLKLAVYRQLLQELLKRDINSEVKNSVKKEYREATQNFKFKYGETSESLEKDEN